MYQLYGLIDGSKYNELFKTLALIYLELDSMADQLMEATSFNLYIVSPDGSQIQELTK